MSSSVSLVTLDAICVLPGPTRVPAARGSSGTARQGWGSVRRPSVRSHVAVRRGCERLDTSTQGEYTKSNPALENLKDFNVSKRQSQILPLRPAFFTIEAVTGNDMGNETVAQRKHFDLSLPKIRSVWIRSLSQNHRIIRADVCDPARALDLRCRHFQVATQAGSREPVSSSSA
jgi:hypothetical protein